MPDEKKEEKDKATILEQYKSLVSDVGNVGTRYATANGFYLSVLTALLGVLAYVGTGKPIDATSYLMILMIAVFAITICWIWRQTIAFYGKLFGAKFAVLKMLEKDLALPVYARESEELEKRHAGHLTDNEAKVPWVLAYFFVLVAGIVILWASVKPAAETPGASSGPATIQQGANPSSPAGQAADETLKIPGTTNIDRWILVVAGLGLVGAGAFAFAGSGHARLAGVVLGTLGATLSLAGALVNEVKLDSLVKIEKASLIDMALQNVGAASPQPLGSIKNFKSGSADEVEGSDSDKQYEDIARQWIANLRAGRDGMLLVVGSTDRVPLTDLGRSRYETNVGLARARAETVKRRVIQTVAKQSPQYALPQEKVIALVTGPENTPSEARTTPAGGFPADRRVDVWGFWAVRPLQADGATRH